MTTCLGTRRIAIMAAMLIGVAATGRSAAETQHRSTASAVLRPAIVFVSTRDNPTGGLEDASEIYLMDPNGTNARRLTSNAYGDALPTLSPDGTRIVFDSNRLRTEAEPPNTAHLFLMNVDGSGETPLVRGSSATWSPDGRRIAFHASASGTSRPFRVEPGAPPVDSDIFVMDVREFLGKGTTPTNITHTPNLIEDDADWSPDGRRIVYTSRSPTETRSNAVNAVSAEIYVTNADGTGTPVRLTDNQEEERAPAWSPDGTRILFVARKGGRDFEVCVMNADGTGVVQLTDNTVGDLTSSWSPDGRKIVFHRIMSPGRYQLWVVNVDGTGEVQLTDTPGLNAFPDWGQVRIPASVQ